MQVYTVRYDCKMHNVCLKLTGRQLSLLHGTITESEAQLSPRDLRNALCQLKSCLYK